jgi:hypothetical protein
LEWRRRLRPSTVTCANIVGELALELRPPRRL